MNELNALINYIPEKYRGLLIAVVMASPLVTRALYAVMNGGGLKGIFRAIWLGTNTPKQTPPPTP